MPLEEAVVRLRGHQVRRLVVVNDAQAVVGLVSLDDVLQLLGEEQQAVAGLMRAACSRAQFPERDRAAGEEETQ